MQALPSAKHLLLLPFMLSSTILQEYWSVFIIVILVFLIYAQRSAHRKKILKLEKKLIKSDSILHEIRNPLTVIGLSCYQIGQQHQTTPRYLERIQRSLLKIQDIIKQKNETKSVAIDQFIAEVIELTTARTHEEKVKLEITHQIQSSHIGAQIVPLQQVLINLINNSCDAIAKLEQKWIKIEMKECHHELAITVTDSGTGIPRQYRHKIMRAYFSTKKQNRNRGLGLAICKEIIQNHKGKFFLNTKSKNTQFIITLPKLTA